MSPRRIWVRDHLRYLMRELDRPFWFANGSGAIRLRDRDVQLFRSQVSVWPRKIVIISVYSPQ